MVQWNSIQNDIVAARQLFPFNTMVVYDKDQELRRILLELVQDVDKDLCGGENV